MSRSTLVAGALLISSFASAQYNFFSNSTFTGTSGVSNNGVAVGIMGSAWGVWNPTVAATPTNIGGNATGSAGISWDGRYVGATANAADGKTELARYDTAAATWSTLGGCGGYSGSNRSVGYGISGDGSTVFGYGYGTYTGTGTGTFTGIRPISNNGSGVASYNIIPNANSINRINGSNYDGTVLAGRMRYYSSGTAQADGAYYFVNGVAKPLMATAVDFYGEAKAVSGDGRYVAGNMNYATDVNSNGVDYRRPYIYDTSTNTATIFDSIAGLNGNAPTSDVTGIDGFVTGMSGDGSTVVGFFRETFPSPMLDKTWGFIWQRGVGVQSIDQWAAANGITGAANTWLVPGAISADGQTIAGMQYTRTGYTSSGFMITSVPEPASMVGLGIGALAFIRRRRSKI